MAGGAASGEVRVSGVPVGADDPVTLVVRPAADPAGGTGDDPGAGRIVAVEPGGRDDVVLAPGLVDVHCHGGGGHEFGRGDDAAAARLHHAHGSTTVVASLVSATDDRFRTAVDALAPLVAADVVAGIHLEGPFLALSQCGAHEPTLLRDPDVRLVDELAERGGRLVMVTLAPERTGASVFVDHLLEAGVVVAVGHTEAPVGVVGDVFARAGAAGTSGVATHLYNGMPPLAEDSPGPVAAVLVAAGRGSAWVELIADGVHLAASTVRATFDLVGERVVLVSDATAATGLGDGPHELGDLPVVVTGRESRLVEGDSLAGSVTPLSDCVRTAIDMGVEPTAAFAAATTHPAAVLGRDDIGHLRPGARADVLELDPDLTLLRTWRRGHPIAESPT